MEFDERAWSTFVTNEMEVDNDLPPASDDAPSEQPIRSGVLVPLGRHGVLCAGCTSPDMFDERTVDLAGTVAATLETALNREDYEQQLEQQNDELTYLNSINTVIRDIDGALVEADTREAINRAVCERLADSDLYGFAWIGEYDMTTETVRPNEWAGVDTAYLESLDITTDDSSENPIGTAMRTGELQVTEDILTDSGFAPWREETLAEGVRSCVGIPLVYEGSPYGVLAVYSREPQSDERDHSVLKQLGETIAHAIDTVERRRTFQTDSVVELELSIGTPNGPLCQLARETGCQVEFEGLVPGSDGNTRVFFTADGSSTEEILRYGEGSLSFGELTCLTDGELPAFKALCSGRTLPVELLDRDVRIHGLSIEDEEATVVVSLPTTLEPREFIEDLQLEYPDTELLARHTREQPMMTRHELQTTVEERLTDRQREVLKTAYLSGFFESPRQKTGQEITASLGISQPTFTQHLRTAQRKLLSTLFDREQSDCT